MPRATRLFIQLEVDYPFDDKIVRLNRYSRDARAIRELLIQMWCYCKREKTDGHVPLEVLGTLALPDTFKNAVRDADRLVEVGIAERTQTGYYLYGFLKRNKSRAEIEADAIKKAEAGKIGGKRSGEVRANEAKAKQGGSRSRSQSTENTGDSSELSKDLGEERPVTLRAVPATSTPKSKATCSRHPDGNPTDEPCGGCARVAEEERRSNERAAEKAARAEEDARRNCVICDGTGIVVDPETRLPTKRKCTDHRRTA